MTQRLDKLKKDKVRGPKWKINTVTRTKLGVYIHVMCLCLVSHLCYYYVNVLWCYMFNYYWPTCFV